VTSTLTGAVYSGQKGVDPEVWRVLPFVQRCHGVSLSARRSTAVVHGVPGSAADSSCCFGAHPSAHRGRQSLASAVSSDALAIGSHRGRQTRTAGAVVLEVRRTFVPSRLSAAYLAAAYAQVVPGHRRRTGVTEAPKVPLAEPTWRRAAGEGRGIRDV
jgi:hypothetical protein